MTSYLPHIRLTPESAGQHRAVLGTLELNTHDTHEVRRLEFSLADDHRSDLNLYVTDRSTRICLVQLQVDYDPARGHHQAQLVISNKPLFDMVNDNPAFSDIWNSYLENVARDSQSFIHKWDNESNSHQVHVQDLRLNGEIRRVELIQQVRAGDCVLATFLNTWSIEHGGQLPMSVAEARALAIKLRRLEDRNADDIRAPDSPLSHADVVRLFSLIHGQTPRQEDILTIDGLRKTTAEVQLEMLDVLEYLDTYSSRLCTIGLRGHSTSIKKLPGDSYALIDPIARPVVRILTTEQVVSYLADLCEGQARNDNFFFFIQSG